MSGKRRTLYLCSGLPSSGSTLVSWCFLQRCDMGGVLDAESDLLPQIDPRLGHPFVWYKTVLCRFRLSELAYHYEGEQWDVRPLLIVRDVRWVLASVQNKPYVPNGITAEDPPLRLQLHRFKQDWEQFQQNGWPMLRYESLLADPETTLRQVCRQLDLPWDEAMLTWPKAKADIADTSSGNESFWASRGSSLAETLAGYTGRTRTPATAPEDLDWLQREFREFNLANGYPTELEPTAPGVPRSRPSFEATRRYEWETKRKRIRWLLARMGCPNRKLIEHRSFKRVAMP